MRRFVLVSFLSCLVVTCGCSATTSRPVTITFYHTSDLHEHSAGLPRIAEFVNHKKEEGGNVLFVDTGDWFNKGDLSPLNTRGEAIVEMMGACGYDAVITGNHEYIHDVLPAIELMKRVGMRVLENEAVEPVPGVRIVGLHDQAARGFGQDTHPLTDEQLVKLLRDDAAGMPTVLLYHQPVRVDFFAELGVDLMLSGHTHEGQLWPFGLIQKMIYPRNVGRYEVSDMTLYVCSGTGTWGPPMRLCTRSELVLVTLRRP